MAAQLPFIQPKHHTHHIHPIHLSQVLNEGRIPVVQKELFFFFSLHFCTSIQPYPNNTSLTS